MKTFFTLPFPPSVNGLFINTRHGRARSSKYDQWVQEAGWELKRQRPSKFKGPVVLFYNLQEVRDKRKRDLGNLEKAVTDLLVTHQVIEADDSTIVREIHMCWDDTVGYGIRVGIFSFVAKCVPINTNQGAQDDAGRQPA